jgi:hypothetical protein
MALLSREHKSSSSRKPWSMSSPIYTMRALTSFGKEIHGSASKDSRPEVTSKDVIGALNRTLPRPRAFSLVSRSYIDETRECTKSPGPQRYTLPGIVANLNHPLYGMPPTKVFVGSSRRMHDISDTPAPGEYDIVPDSYLKRSPSFGFRIKPFESKQSGLAPDSGSYDVLDLTRHGKVWRGPSWSLRSRIEDRKNERVSNAEINALMLADAPNILGRKKRDTSGSKRSNPIPNWSFSKSRRFLQ